jgi:hypothetical protein
MLLMDKPNDPGLIDEVKRAVGSEMSKTQGFARWYAAKRRSLGTAFPSWVEKNGGQAGVRSLYSQTEK